MNDLLNIIFLSMLPISELRGAIPFGILSGLDWQLVFIVSVIANIAVIPIAFLFLDYVHKHLTKYKNYNLLFDKAVVRTRKKIETKIGTKWEIPSLITFVAIPLPMTGGYSGVLAAWLFNIQRKKAILSIAAGIMIAGIITTLLVIGVTSFFSSF